MVAYAPDFVEVVEVLQEQVAELRAENERLRARIKQLEDENRHLREQLEQAQRASMRQAAPFRREERRKVPEAQKKRPGQKPGHPGHCRSIPNHLDETIELPLPQCPHCGESLADPERIEQIIEEIRPIAPSTNASLTTSVRWPGRWSYRARKKPGTCKLGEASFVG